MKTKKILLALTTIAVLLCHSIALWSYDSVQVEWGDVWCSEPVVPTPEPDCDNPAAHIDPVDAPYVAPTPATTLEQKTVQHIKKSYNAQAQNKVLAPAKTYHNSAPSTLPITWAWGTADVDPSVYEEFAKKQQQWQEQETQKSQKIDAPTQQEWTTNARNFWERIEISEVGGYVPMILATIDWQEWVWWEHASADAAHASPHTIGLVFQQHTVDAILLLFLLFLLWVVLWV